MSICQKSCFEAMESIPNHDDAMITINKITILIETCCAKYITQGIYMMALLCISFVPPHGDPWGEQGRYFECHSIHLLKGQGEQLLLTISQDLLYHICHFFLDMLPNHLFLFSKIVYGICDKSPLFS